MRTKYAIKMEDTNVVTNEVRIANFFKSLPTPTRTLPALVFNVNKFKKIGKKLTVFHLTALSHFVLNNAMMV